MAKLISIVLLVVGVAVCATEAARLRNFRQSKFSARQEVEPEQDVAAVTPYPPAGIVPEVRFNLPNEPAVLPEDPEKTYLPPDNLLPPAQTYGPPAQTYGPPEVEAEEGNGNDAPLADDDDAAAQQPEEVQADEPVEEDNVDPEAEEVVNPQLERFVLARNFRRPAKLRAAKLQALPVAVRPRSQRLIAQPVYSTNGALIAYRMLRV
ncbi:titin-like [Episyrphus balteatus]|uniref:titin-like n=1 Tax=Episyrphus balteatus TaxID=286459 RepID=UPI0024856A60|nr:titin-like [Episyrphus balteatus]